MRKELTCIVCPNGCSLVIEQTEESLRVEGALCRRGEAYARQELTDPRRTVSTLVSLEGGETELLSVRLTKPIPLDQIEEAVRQIHELTVKSPVCSGQVLIHRILDQDSDVIATRNG